MKLAFLGLGIMGAPMAANLVRAGHAVTVWNRSAERCAPLVELGAAQAPTAAAAAAAADITFVMVSDPGAARAVCCGPDGALAGLAAGKGYVDLSTVDAGTSCELAAAVTARGARFLEAPVSGTRKPAEDGTLIILAAGDRSLYDAAGPLLDVLGKKRMYLGATGCGARMKLVVNMVMGGMMTAFCEGLALAGRGGLDPADLLEVLDAGALANPMFRGKGPLILAQRFGPAFPLKHMQKDLRLALALGDELAQPLATAAAANELFKRARALGGADEDFCAVWRAVTAG